MLYVSCVDLASESNAAWCSLLDKIQPRVVSYEEQVTTVREHLANLLEKEEEWSKAAQTLAGIDLDSGVLVFGYPDWRCATPAHCKCTSKISMNVWP